MDSLSASINSLTYCSLVIDAQKLPGASSGKMAEIPGTHYITSEDTVHLPA